MPGPHGTLHAVTSKPHGDLIRSFFGRRVSVGPLSGGVRVHDAIMFGRHHMSQPVDDAVEYTGKGLSLTHKSLQTALLLSFHHSADFGRLFYLIFAHIFPPCSTPGANSLQFFHLDLFRTWSLGYVIPSIDPTGRGGLPSLLGRQGGGCDFFGGHRGRRRPEPCAEQQDRRGADSPS